MKDEKERQNEQSNVTNDLNKARKLWIQGQIKEALLILMKLEKSDNCSYRESLLIKLLKANIFSVTGEYIEAINCTGDLFQKFQKEGDLLLSFDTLSIQSHSLVMLGKLSKGETVVKQAETLLKKIKKTHSIDLRERESFFSRIRAQLNMFKGDIQNSLHFNKRAYDLAKDTDNIVLIFASLTNLGFLYFILKEYDKAIIYSKKAINLNYEPGMAFPISNLIDIFIKKNDIKQAKVYFEYLGELKEKYDTKIYNEIYNLYTALFLKSSLRSRERIKAEDICQKIAFDNTATHEGRIAAIIHLCDLLLIELRLSNDPEILDEIQPYIQKLLELAERQQNSLILAETYLLQEKLSLLTFDNKAAKRFLTQAKQIAERFGHKEMVERIMNEQSTLLKKSNTWEQLRNTGAPMAERIKLAKLQEQIEELDEKRVILPAFVREEQVTIHQDRKTCLVCRGEVLRFSYICECGTIYCESCVRAVTELENACWVCDVPIDYSKPVKQIEEEPEEINFDKKYK